MPRNLMPLAWLVAIMVAIDGLKLPLVMATSYLMPELFAQTTVAEIDTASIGFYLLTAVVFAVWIVMAGQNLRRLGFEDLEFSPASRVWWFFIPIANLFRPFQGMRELWNASHGEEHYGENQPIVSIWWALWLANGLISGFLPEGSVTWLTVLAVVGIALSGVAIAMIFRITIAQNRPVAEDLAEVFA
ncbi:DUF4328 domain-containing protein [Stakelama tenebrarum]|uniref:DUF4328 domain-containing protein n=1 Tax=Stakelama tenebrarum TaxID=2711215 RepID=A0A6G6Y7R5_9SPHN|nr:DUF4328 domain-containing protein [Sphingosinithalassobacter tenebrarum]QIG80984.1 DUF4328 domain-containing protein [Sphingosinithalassobacter tenebrarum]